MGSEPLLSIPFCCQDRPSFPFPPFLFENTIGAISNFGSKFVTPFALINYPETMNSLINPIATFLNCLYRIAEIMFWRPDLAKHWMDEFMKVTRFPLISISSWDAQIILFGKKRLPVLHLSHCLSGPGLLMPCLFSAYWFFHSPLGRSAVICVEG